MTVMEKNEAILWADQRIRIEKDIKRSGDPGERAMLGHFLEVLDFDKYATIQKKHLTKGAQWRKFLKLASYLRGHYGRAVRQGLPGSQPVRILDIGCGGGHYAAVASYLGHTVIGIDVPGDQLIKELNSFFATTFVENAVKPMTKLTVDGRFDLITAASANFFRKKAETGWTVWNDDEWRFFFDDLKSHLSPGGLIELKLNKRRQGDYIHYRDPKFIELVRSNNGNIDDDGFLTFGKARLATA